MSRPFRVRRLAAVALVGVAALVASTVPALAAADPAATPPVPPAAGELWTAVTGTPAPTSAAGRAPEVRPVKYRAFTLDQPGMRGVLAEAPAQRSAAAVTAPLVVELPTPTAGFERFAVAESSVMSPGLAALHPEIKTYSGRSLDDPRVTVRMDTTPLGLHASVRGAPGRGAWYIDPYYNRDTSVYVSYFGQDLLDPHGTFVEREDGEGSLTAPSDPPAVGDVPAGPSVTLRTYRLALLTDPSYARYFGTENVTAAKVTLMNRVNQVYEDDLAVHLELIDETDKLNLDTEAKATGANGPCGAAACFTPAQVSGCGSSTLSRNRIVLGQLVGASAFDIGHIGLGLNGGGIASLGVVGRNAKAQGCTGLPTPVGDFYAVDYVAHEMGHQFSGPHTFNGTQLNCSGTNRSGGSSVEPGSGSSVMAYAGICQQDNLQPHSDPYFSERSHSDIGSYIRSSQAAINEVQTVSLREFDTNGESFRLRYEGRLSGPLTRGTTYNEAGLTAEISRLTGDAVSVTPFGGGTGIVGDTGFQVTWNATLGGRNLPSLELAELTGDVSGFVGETAKGGPVQNGGRTAVDSGNHAPVVTGAGNHTIPLRTPFALTGRATDSDGDAPSYLWEQNDPGGATGTALVSNTKTNGPLFRQFGVAAQVTKEGTLTSPSPGINLADGNPTRVFPDMAQILAGNTNAATGRCPDAPPPPPSGGASNVPAAIVDCYSEFLPTADYAGATGSTGPARLHMRLTVRDRHPGAGGVGIADSVLTLASGTGPFRVTSLAAPGQTVQGGDALPVTWAVNGTDAPALAPDVRISLSTDGGYTYPTVLAESTPNDGAHTVQLPHPTRSETRSRIKVEAVGNVFFDVNHADFTLQPSGPAPSTTTVTVSRTGANSTPQFSDRVSVAATVAPAPGSLGGGAYTGTVFVTVDGVAAGSRPISGATPGGTVTLPVRLDVRLLPAGAGSSDVVARFVPSTGGYAGSTGTRSVEVKREGQAASDATDGSTALTYTGPTSVARGAKPLLSAALRQDSEVVDFAKVLVRGQFTVLRSGTVVTTGTGRVSNPGSFAYQTTKALAAGTYTVRTALVANGYVIAPPRSTTLTVR